VPADGSTYQLILHQPSRPLLRIARKLLIILKILLIAALLLSRVPYYGLFALILAAATVIEWLALTNTPAVLFSDTGVRFRGVFSKTYRWEELDHVILRDGLLTIDFRTNRLFQKEVDGKTSEPEFNAWCRNRLSGLKK